MGNIVELSYGQVGMATLLIAVNALASIVLNLRIEKVLAVAAVRTVSQLLLVGLVLEWVFRLERWFVVLGLGLVMTLVAGLTAAGRTKRRYRGMERNTVVSVWASAWIVTGYVMLAVLRGVEHWYQPQYSIPLLGMALGNTLNGISVGLSTLLESLATRRGQVDALLALGATRWEAARGILGDAVQTGMIPIINSMMVVGIVSLPGMMTGQLVSGIAPIEAVKYQIVIMFMVASATAIGTVGVVLLSYRRLFNDDHQFLAQRIVPRAADRTGR